MATVNLLTNNVTFLVLMVVLFGSLGKAQPPSPNPNFESKFKDSNKHILTVNYPGAMLSRLRVSEVDSPQTYYVTLVMSKQESNSFAQSLKSAWAKRLSGQGWKSKPIVRDHTQDNTEFSAYTDGKKTVMVLARDINQPGTGYTIQSKAECDKIASLLSI